MRRIAYLTDMDVLGTPGLSTAAPRITARAVVVNPHGMLAVMYAAKYDNDTALGSELAAQSSVLSVITMPIIVALASVV